jgi:hypothetical protein
VTRKEAEERGYTVDRSCYPWVAYKGLRFNPEEWKPILTDLEEELLGALQALKSDQAYQQLHGWPFFTSAPTEMEWKAESRDKAWGLAEAAMAKAEARR